WCMAGLAANELETHSAGFRSLGADAVPERFLGVFGHECFELSSGFLMLDERGPRATEHPSKLGPRIGLAHVDHPNRRQARSRRLGAKKTRRLAGLHATPEFSLRRQQKVLIKRIGVHGD